MPVRKSLRLAAVVAMSTVAMSTAAALPAQAATPDAMRCSSTTPPSWFYPDLVAAEKADSSIPDSWGKSYDMARIACWESSYLPHASNGDHWGLGQLTKANIATYKVTWDHYWNGSSTHAARYYQIVAMLRYCKARYGTPAKGWAHEVADGWW